MKLTPWYPGHIKPVRPGVYQQYSGSGNVIGYQHWDGFLWHSWASSPERAARGCMPPASQKYQNDTWRGIAK